VNRVALKSYSPRGQSSSQLAGRLNLLDTYPAAQNMPSRVKILASQENDSTVEDIPMNEPKNAPPIRYGILGFGHHAAKRLVPSFRLAQRARLEGLYRRDLAKAADNARAFSIPRAFDTAEALCASPEIDAVFVVSPDALHLEHVLLALDHGKPVLCEKPLAMNVGEVEQMLAAADKAGVLLGVAQNMRYNQSLQRMRTLIAEGSIGAPQLAHAQFCYESERSPRAWINDPTLARGGPIGDVGIHCMDALCFVLGQPADRIKAVATLAHRDSGSGQVESHAVVAIEYASGAMATVTVTTRASYRSLVEVVGASGALVCENAMTIDHPVDLVHTQAGKLVSEETISNAHAFADMLDSFAGAISGSETYLASAEEGLANQRVLDAAYDSWHTGRRISLG
jgi:predicted dehydrogenase